MKAKDLFTLIQTIKDIAFSRFEPDELIVYINNKLYNYKNEFKDNYINISIRLNTKRFFIEQDGTVELLNLYLTKNQIIEYICNLKNNTYKEYIKKLINEYAIKNKVSMI